MGQYTPLEMMKIVLLAALVAGIAAKSIQLPTNKFLTTVTGRAQLLDMASDCTGDGSKCDQEKIVKDYMKCVGDNQDGMTKCKLDGSKLDCSDASCKKLIKCTVDAYCAMASPPRTPPSSSSSSSSCS